jgi:hypothetical protein
MPRLSLGLGVQNIRKVGGGGTTPSGIAYANASAVAISAINFTLAKTFYGNDASIINYWGSPYPTNWYGFSDYNYESGTGNQAILAFNTTANIYYSQQPSNVPDVSLSSNKWYLIVFSAGLYDSDSGTYPPVPSTVYVNNSTGQSASYIPTSSWSPTITIQNGAYANDGVNFNFDFAGSSDILMKNSNTLWSVNIDGSDFTLTWNYFVANQWVLDCDGAGTPQAARATNTNGGSSTFIPSTGWSYIIGSGQAITLSPAYP